LNVADAEAVAAFAPVRETLTQFISMYGEMSESVEARMAALAHGAKADGKERKWRK
jgi:hypothetical protein